MSETYAEYGIADIGVAGMMTAGYHSGELLAMIGQYLTPAVADIGIAGLMVAGIYSAAASYRQIAQGSLKITDTRNDVSTASFSIRCLYDERPAEGDPVIIALGTLEDPLFAGYIESTDEGRAAGDKYEYACMARALARDLEKRIISAYDCAAFEVPTTWTNTYAGEILSALLSAFTPHFWDGGHIEQGVYIQEITLIGSTLFDACQKLATRSNVVFYIAPTREIIFQRQTVQTAAWQLDDTEYFSGLKIREHGTKIKNRIAIYYSELEDRTEIFAGDDEQTVFILERLPHEISSLTVNGTPVTYGTRYAEDNSEHDFSINYNMGEIHAQAYGTPEEGDTLTIVYTAAIPALYIANHVDSQLDHADRDGGDGIYDFEIHAEQDIFSLTDARDRAQTELENYAYHQMTAAYERRDYLYDFQNTRLRVGQQQSLQIRGRDVSLTVERVIISVAIPQYRHKLKFSQQIELGPVSRGLESLFREMQDTNDVTLPEITTTEEV